MGRIITVIVAIASCLLIWKSGAVDSVIPSSFGGSASPAPTFDATANITAAGDAMSKLKSVHITMTGNLVLGGLAGVIVTGTGDLIYPHKENLSLQLKVPTSSGDEILAVNERIEGGHEYVQIPSQSQTWKDVTGDSKSQITPGMDPIANLEFVHAFRAADDQGDITMDNIDVHHFSLTVDGAKYVSQLKADPSSGITAADEAELTNAGIEVDVWISASDHYVHQMRIQMNTTAYTWDLTYHFSDFQTGGSTASA
jgi:hypothetical protein